MPYIFALLAILLLALLALLAPRRASGPSHWPSLEERDRRRREEEGRLP